MSSKSKIQVKLRPKSNAERCKEYRATKNTEEAREAERERCRNYRKNLSDEQKERYNTMGKERMRRSRERKKELQKQDAVSRERKERSDEPKRSAVQLEEDRKKYKREKAREYRARMDPKKKWWIKKKDREAKQQKKEQKIREQESKKATNEEAGKSRRDRIEARQLKTPEVYTEHVVELIEKATPRKRKLLHKEGIFRKVVREKTVEAIRSCTADKKSRKVVALKIRATNSRVRKPLQRIFGVANSSVHYKPKQKLSKGISTEMKQLVQDFYKDLDVSTQFPNKRKTKGASEMYMYILQRSIKEIHQEFMLEHPDAKIGLVTFGKLRPKNVKLQQAMKWLQCICDICDNVDNLLKAIRLSMVRSGFEVPASFYSSKKIAESSICCMLSYNEDCLARKCNKCGTGHIEACLNEWSTGESLVNFRQWEYVAAVVKQKEIQRLKPQLKELTRPAAKKLLMEKLHGYAKHSFMARWQQRAYKDAISTMANDEVVAVADFAENYTAQRQHEAQSAYYSRNILTIHPIVCQYKVDGKLVRDSIIFISDDLKHDSAAVTAFIKGAIIHLSDTKPDFKRLVMFSDGCASQYKSKRPFQNIARRFDNPCVDIQWNFFGSHHGKGPSDGETGVLKSKMRRLVLGGQYVVDSAEDFFNAAQKELTVLDGASKRHIYYIGVNQTKEERENMAMRDVTPVPGIRQIHQVTVDGFSDLRWRYASCFCDGCRQGEECDRSVPAWKTVNVKLGESEFDDIDWHEFLGT